MTLVVYVVWSYQFTRRYCFCMLGSLVFVMGLRPKDLWPTTSYNGVCVCAPTLYNPYSSQSVTLEYCCGIWGSDIPSFWNLYIPS